MHKNVLLFDPLTLRSLKCDFRVSRRFKFAVIFTLGANWN